MNIFALVPLASFATCLVAGALVFSQNRKSLTNRILLLYCLFGVYYGVVEFGLIQARSYEEAFFWRQAGAVWLFIPSLLLHFVLSLTEKRKWLTQIWTYILIYLPAFIFSLIDLSTHAVLGEPEKLAWGWAYGAAEDVFIPFLAYIWAVGMGLISVFLCWRYNRNTTEAAGRQNAKYVLRGLALPLLALLVVDGLLPGFGIKYPEFASAALAVGSSLIAYGVLRHNLFAVTPAAAADIIIEKMSDALFLTDAKGQIVMANQAALNILRCKENELINQPLQEILDPDAVPKAEERMNISSEKHYSDSIETTINTKGGRSVTMSVTMSQVYDSGGVELGRIYVGRDITERKRMEEALLLKEKAIEDAVSAIAMSDMEGRITYVNRTCMKLWGSEDKEEILGKPYWIMLKSAEVVKTIASEMLENKHWEGELVAVRRNGQEVHVQVIASMVEDDKGHPIQTISSLMDVTEKKKMEAERESMEQQLQLAGRLAAVGELAAGVAHELNNPLAAVQAFAQFLADKKDLDKETRGDIETIYKESQRASKITGNLLSFSRRYKPEKGRVSINEVVKKSLELHAYRMRVNNIQVIEELDPALPMTMADFHQLEQVFVNIIANAEQAITDANGQGTMKVSTDTGGEMIRIIFADNGPGIPEENLGNVFDPFFTTKEVGKGTGLGLSICFGIVQEHGGRLYAQSKPGQGATFTVELPIIPEG